MSHSEDQERLSAGQRAQLVSLFDTFVGPLSDAETEDIVRQYGDGTAEREAALRQFCKRKASDLGVAEDCIALLLDPALVPPSEQEELLLALALLSRPATSFLLTGHWSAFSDLPAEERAAVLRGWATSALESKRALHKVFKAVCGKCFMSKTVADPSTGRRDNPNWSAIGYPGPDPERDSPRYVQQEPRAYHYRFLEPHPSAEPLALEFDAVVVGSGCGGGVMAAELSKAGRRVLVVEKGRYFHQSQMSLFEEDIFSQMYEQQAVLGCVGGGVQILAGSCFGGGSTINWGCSLRTPAHVREEWADLGLPAFLGSSFQASLEAICIRANVTDDNIQHDATNAILIRGCQRLGFSWKVAHQNIRPGPGSTHSCGWCFGGCRYAEKQGTQVTFLRDAAEHGAQFLVGCTVDRVLSKRSPRHGGERRRVCTGIEARYQLPGGGVRKVLVSAPLVALAAGAIHTPLLMRRSGLSNGWIGENLRLHPVTLAMGRFEESVRPWEGSIMTTVCTEAETGPDGDWYGSKLEVPCLHPALEAAALPWESSRQYKEAILRYPNQSSILVLTRDSGAGRVLEADGLPRIEYEISGKDARALISGLKIACKTLIAAGALSLRVTTNGIPEYVCTELGVQDPGFEAWWRQIERVGGRVNQCCIFSAHQMGTARMGCSPAKGAVDPHGQSWEMENLFVCDTSTFPTPSGANPMVTCFAISHFIAQLIISPNAKL